MHSRIHPVIRPSLYIFIIVFLVVIAVVVGSQSYLNDVLDEEKSAKRAMRIWKNKIDGSRRNNELVDKYENSYLALVRSNIIGEENRLSWYETIQATSEARGMRSVKYNVAFQKPVQEQDIKNKPSELDVYRSVMALDMKIAHEGDMFAMLNSFDDNAKGLFAVDMCNLERVDLSIDGYDAIGKDNMKAICEISWYTIKSSEKVQGI